MLTYMYTFHACVDEYTLLRVSFFSYIAFKLNTFVAF